MMMTDGTDASAGTGDAGAAGAEALFKPAGDAGAGGSDGGKPAGQEAAPWWQADGMQVSAEKADAKALSDAEWLANKKYGSPGELVKAARALEAKIGEKGIMLPKGPDDAEGHKALRAALGVPETPDGYDIKLADGYDEGFVKGFLVAAHEAGLPPAAAQKLVDWFEQSTAAEAAASAEVAAGKLKAEWKEDYQQQLDLARQGMEKLGLTPEDLNAFAVGAGLDKVMLVMNRIGRGLAEDNGLPGTGGSSPAMTAETVAARKAEINASPELRAKLLAGDKALTLEWKAIAAFEADQLAQRYTGGAVPQRR